ncbi:hypothetical protein BDC45DRAFT_567981 [Circinella umbellata]|nr:hypothetical protein BDC45DRAFT_567981 [Circinella umbellata]
MSWPPVSPKSLAIWESRGRDPKCYKNAWKYIHRKKYPIVQNTSNGTGNIPITVEGDGGKPQIKKDNLQESNELLTGHGFMLSILRQALNSQENPSFHRLQRLCSLLNIGIHMVGSILGLKRQQVKIFAQVG